MQKKKNMKKKQLPINNNEKSKKLSYASAFLLLSFLGLMISFLQYFDFWNLATFLCLIISLIIYIKEKMKVIKSNGYINIYLFINEKGLLHYLPFLKKTLLIRSIFDLLCDI